jgi:RHS repeat-associated protein
MIKSDGTKYFYHHNAQYSVSALTDSSSNVVERYGYDAYGRQLVMDGAGVVKTTPRTQNYGFTGRELDNETGLWYFRARMYSDKLGRFVSRDPSGYVDGMGLYGGYFVPNKLDYSGLISLNYSTYNSPSLPQFTKIGLASDWKIQWQINMNQEDIARFPHGFTGIIIQRIWNTFEATDEYGDAVSFDWPYDTQDSVYFEAWVVVEGNWFLNTNTQYTGGRQLHDVWHRPTVDADCTKGTMTISSWATILYNNNSMDPQSELSGMNFGSDNGHEGWGGLYGLTSMDGNGNVDTQIYSNVALFINGFQQSNFINRQLSMTWDYTEPGSRSSSLIYGQ